jgi:periplasmic protein TonB
VGYGVRKLTARRNIPIDAGLKAAPHDQLRLSLATASDADRGVIRALAIGASLVLSLLLHGSVLAAALLLIEPKPGAGVLPTEAISVEIIPSSVLEAALTSPSPDASASASSVQSDPGAVEDAAAASSEGPNVVGEVEEKAAPPHQAAEIPYDGLRGGETPVDALDEPQEPTEPAFKQAAAVIEPEKMSPPPAPSPQPTERMERAKPPHPRKAQKEPMKKGGTPSRATKGSAASSGRVSASEGSTINYTALVRARVASRRPSGPGMRGTVVVIFGVSRSGGLAFASIKRSSGDQLLDRTVLSAVRNAAPFPTPPSGIASSQLRFSMPFYFH